jgi:hypothetical protein
MNNKIINWVLIALVVVIGCFMLFGSHLKSRSTTAEGVTIIDGASSNDPTVDHFFKVDGIFTVAANAFANLLGTTTIAHSPDGYVAWDDFTVATGSAKAVFTNTFGDMLCDADSGSVFVNSSGFAPSLVFSLGTSTSATVASLNLIASTTVATSSTNGVIPFTYNTPFRLKNGESIVGSLADYSAPIASSTNFANWAFQFQVHCWTMGS